MYNGNSYVCIIQGEKMIYKNFDQLSESIKKNNVVKIVALVAAEDEHALEAVILARKENIVKPILVGNENKICELLCKLGEEPLNYCIIAANDNVEAASIAVNLIGKGEADFLMKGKIETASLLRVVVGKNSPLRTGKLMSHPTFYEIPGRHKLLALTDGGIVPYPDLEQKKQLVNDAVQIMADMGFDKPKVAALAVAEQVSPKMSESVDAAELKKMNEEGEITGCVIEGPISYDLIMSKESAKIKGYPCPYCGDFDLIIAPNMITGNVLGKVLVYNAGAKMAGFIVGAKVPIALTSRGSSAEEKYMALVLAAGAAKTQAEKGE